jgi:hypothetical protein
LSVLPAANFGIICLCAAKQHLLDAFGVTEEGGRQNEIHQNKVSVPLVHITILMCYKCRNTKCDVERPITRLGKCA